MLNAHFMLITSNMTTVEQMGAQRMRSREQRVLSRLHKWWEFRARRETREQWDGEWGRIGKEGHMWWLGGARQNWEAVMGDRVWMWFCECDISLTGVPLWLGWRAYADCVFLFSARWTEPGRRPELHGQPAVRRGGPVAAAQRVAEGASVS